MFSNMRNIYSRKAAESEQGQQALWYFPPVPSYTLQLMLALKIAHIFGTRGSWVDCIHKELSLFDLSGGCLEDPLKKACLYFAAWIYPSAEIPERNVSKAFVLQSLLLEAIDNRLIKTLGRKGLEGRCTYGFGCLQ